MKIVPKPEGFEMRQKRADKAEVSRLWLPEDAMHAASAAMKDPKLAILVAWYEKHENGHHVLKYRIWQEYPRASVALVADVMVDLSS